VASGIRERVSVKEQGYVFGGNNSRSFEERVWGDGDRIQDSPDQTSPWSSELLVWVAQGMCKWIGTSGQ
jgi:hypothetical protein